MADRTAGAAVSITIDLMECPKCGHIEEPVILYQFACDLMGYAHDGEHFHVVCRRCSYRTALPVPL